MPCACHSQTYNGAPSALRESASVLSPGRKRSTVLAAGSSEMRSRCQTKLRQLGQASAMVSVKSKRRTRSASVDVLPRHRVLRLVAIEGRAHVREQVLRVEEQ